MKFQAQINSNLISCLLCMLIVFALFQHTLDYAWKNYDEHILYEETILPIPENFSEIFEIIKNIGFNHYFESANPLYSNISNMRGSPIDVFTCLLFFYLFKTSAFKYHLFSLILHLLNTCLCFFILKKVINDFIKIQGAKISINILTMLLTLIWALHPTNVETILFATNFGALITYFFSLAIFLYFLHSRDEFLKNKLFRLSLSICLFIVYSFIILLNEYSILLPILIFLYEIITYQYQNKKIPDLQFLRSTIIKLLPLLTGLCLFSAYFFFTPEIRNNNISNFSLTIQRIFWLSPQIFFHDLKLIILPLKLSLDQTTFVRLSNSLFGKYAIFCFMFMYIPLFLSLISIPFSTKRLGYFTAVIFLPFFISLLPFLHIISPIYNLTSERYLYLPTFFLIFGLTHLIANIFAQYKKVNSIKLITCTLLFFLTCGFGTRTFLRALDWKDSFTLLDKTSNLAPSSLYKGLREHMILRLLKSDDPKLKPMLNDYYEKTSNSLEMALKELKIQEKFYQKNTPPIVKYYGLDPKSLILKCVFLKALTESNYNGDSNKALEILLPQIKNLNLNSTLILDFTYKLFFNTGNIDKAEALLKKALKQNKPKPSLLVAISDLIEYKYKNYALSEKYLLNSFKYFPYDEATLFGLKRLYRNKGNAKEFAHYSYLFGLRTHDKTSYKEACAIYIAIHEEVKAKKILEKLLEKDPYGAGTSRLLANYREIFGDL